MVVVQCWLRRCSLETRTTVVVEETRGWTVGFRNEVDDVNDSFVDENTGDNRINVESR